MKTFTNYAEKKAKQFLNLLQGYTKGIRITAILILLLMGVSNAWAYDLAANQYVYFEKPADWSNVSLLLGHNSWSQGYNMTKITNTNLYSWTTVSWGGYTRYCFIDATGWGGEGKKPDDRKGYASHSTNVFTNQLIKYHLFTSSGSKSSHASDRKIAINRTQTIKVQLKDGSNWVDATVVPADLTASTYAMTTSSTAVSAASASLAKESTTVSATVSAAYSATVTLSCTDVLDGYVFDGWYDANGNKITSYTVSDAHTVYARFIQSAEETNEVSVTYMCDATVVSPAIAEIVGVETEKSFTAPTVTGYNFTGWTIGAGITLKAGTASDATITVVTKSAASDYTLVANYEEVLETIYFINTGKWSVVNLHRWGGTAAETPWPGEAMTKTGEKIGDYDVYSFTAQQGAFANVIFTNKNTGSDQTADLTWTAGKYYIYNYGGNSGWYTQAEAEDILLVPVVYETVYFVNNKNWSLVQIHAWNGGSNNGWPGQALTATGEKVEGFDVYSFTATQGSYTNLLFNNKVGDTGEQSSNYVWTADKYYYMGAAENYAGGTKEEVADLLLSTTIYFKNNLGWENVYVYFHTSDSYWDETNGSGAYGLTEQNGRAFKMDRIGESDIYKCYYGGTVPTNSIVFTKDQKEGEPNFSNTKASYRTDFDPKMQLFIPQNTKTTTKKGTEYFNKGLWMKYNSTESGYTITGDFNTWNQESDKFTSETSGGYIFQKELLLSSEHTYVFKIKNIKNDWFRTDTAITSTKNTDIEFTAGDGENVTITALSDGYYTFSIDLSTGKMLVSVEYPLMVGDYRMVYVENEVLGVKPYVKFHPAQSIRGITEGEKLDTVSFFINKTNGKNPAILLQRCSNINGAIITWEDIAIQYINGNGGANPVLAQAPAKKSAELHIGNGCPAVTNDAVYNFVLEQTNTGAQILAENTHLYEGNYYIRTDGAAGGWSKYNTNPDNIMTHSQTALTHGGYDYYFCEWMLKNNNVKYVVANDYSYCVSDTLAKDDIVTDENGNLPADANVRYTWNSSTNALKRAYINGSGKAKDRYLVLIGNEYLKDASGNTFPVGTGDRTGLNANETTFADMGNWLYQVDIKASEETFVKLTANYNGKIQYFKGAADATVPIITGAENEYKFRLIYDFKTNYLLCGLTEDGEISEHISVDEAMIMRSHHELAQTFNVTNAGSIKTIKTIYGVMNFNKNTLNGAGSEHERALYWVSFPFDVDLGKAFGFGNYGEHWIMEYYDGKERAEKGLWKEPTYSYWKYITNPNYILEAGKGYVLCLDLDLLGPDADFWDNTNDIALYFPSNDENITIDSNPASKETKVDAWECTIERDDRKTKDSNWNIIGVAGYKNFLDIDTEDLGFYYEYFATNNKYAVNKAAEFNCMHAYMVQFAGTINWAANQVTKAIAARKQSSGKDQYTLRLALQQEDTQCDHTFIRLQEDNATAEFDMNYDLCKIINSGANIYSMIGNVEVAANVLPVEERIIPLGLDIHETGNYTFAMPDGTDGITAILIDYETGTETNLLLADYTTELREGTNNERFALRVRPNHVATEVENTILTDSNDNAKKYIIDGALYLLRNGKLYDAQGRMIQQ